jgi:ubiquitin carboxyl-terminal hydrolase 10
LASLTYAWTQIDKFSQVAHLAHIRRKVPLDRTRAKPARLRYLPRLAITPTEHPSLPLLSPPSVLTNRKLFSQPDSVQTIQDSLVHISQPQPLKAGQPSSIEASQQVTLEALPPILVLHLERFLYDGTADGIVKISKPIQFAPELEISLGTIFSSFISSVLRLIITRGSVCTGVMTPVAGKSAELVNYKLCGVLYHHGESANGGHYTIDVLHQSEDSGSEEAWLHIDDEGVNAVRHEDVFGGRDSEQLDDRCVYMLFYCRTAPV